MGHPFGDAAKKYMDSMKGILADETWKTRERRYRRMERSVINLKEQKRISTMSPKQMTPEDVRVILLDHKIRVGNSDMAIHCILLDKLMDFIGNDAYRECLRKYPGIRPQVKHPRKPSMDDDLYKVLLKKANGIPDDDYYRLRAFSLVMLCICTGTRNKEIRFANVGDINTVSWRFDIIHIKGEESYGQPRTVPIHPDIRPLVSRYLASRERWLAKNGRASKALFVTQSTKGDYLSGNGIRRMKDMVEDEIGTKFDLRKCRRTFGQRYIDQDVDIETVSVLMGHSTTRTTESFYGRRKNEKAMEKLEAMWKKNTEDDVTEP